MNTETSILEIIERRKNGGDRRADTTSIWPMVIVAVACLAVGFLIGAVVVY